MDALLTRIDAEKKQVAKLKFGYDIETDWTMFTTCNYACDYCFFDAEALGKSLKFLHQTNNGNMHSTIQA